MVNFVWVLTGGIDYEDTYVLGIYKTEEAAKRAKHKEQKEGDLDWLSIDKWTVEGE